MPRTIDITGQTFGRLTVIDYAGSRDKQAIWNCQCACGSRVTVIGKCLRRGTTKSCGCWRSDNWFIQKRTHGESHTRLHRIWTGMKTRCGNPHCAAFPRYGGRGISVCPEWHQFEPFRDWAMANGYTNELTIDRIENDGNYEPENCRWATYSEQGRNTSKTRAVIRSDGKRFKCVKDAALESGSTTSRIALAIKRNGTSAGYGWRYD